MIPRRACLSLSLLGFSRCISHMPSWNSASLMFRCVRRHSASAIPSKVFSATNRSHTFKSVGSAKIDTSVQLFGWVNHVREMGGHLMFITLRDAFGVVQLATDDGASSWHCGMFMLRIVMI